MYGIWLDGKRVPNHVLNNYKHTDFANFWQSGLTKTAAHYGQYKYHLSLSTPATHAAYLEEVKKDTSRYTVWYKQEFYIQVREKTGSPSNKLSAPKSPDNKQGNSEKIKTDSRSSADFQKPESLEPSENITKKQPEDEPFETSATPDFTKFGATLLPKKVEPLSQYRFRVPFH